MSVVDALRSDLDLTEAPKPMPDFSDRLAMTFSSPSKAPPQMNRMLVVSICRKSWFGVLSAPLRRHRSHRA